MTLIYYRMSKKIDFVYSLKTFILLYHKMQVLTIDNPSYFDKNRCRNFDSLLTSSESNNNNTIIINNNFAYTVALNTNLLKQIEQLNAHITELQNKIEITNGNVYNLNMSLTSNISRLEQSEIKIIELVKKVSILLSYLPQFVQDTTSYFVRLITSIKMGNTDDLPMITYDTHLLEV